MSKLPVHIIGDVNTANAPIVTVPKQNIAFIEDIKISVDSSPVAPHGVAKHGSPKTANGSSFVTIDDIPVNHVTNPDTCGHERDSSIVDGFLR